MSQRARDKQCDLDHGKAEVVRDEKKLDEKLARLDLHKKEVTELKDIKEIVDCSDTFTKECRYAFYLDLVERLKINCPTADEYMCELVDQVKELDKTRQRVRDMEKEVRVVEDQLVRVTKLRDDLVAGWRDELCRAVTDGAVAQLAPDLATACATGSRLRERALPPIHHRRAMRSKNLTNRTLSRPRNPLSRRKLKERDTGYERNIL